LVEYTSTKVCKDCQQEKSVSEFYERVEGGWLTAYCKVCHRIRSKRQQRGDRKIAVVQSEGDVITQLLKQGIPALPGKALQQQWADVIAWGCVLLEVKSSLLHDRQFAFAFTPKQRSTRLRGDLVVLVCRYEDKNTYHVFPSNHNMFYSTKGKLKTAVSWTPDRSNAGGHIVVTDEMMADAENRWDLIEDYRLKISTRLLHSQEFPVLINAA
jgi:hypothetical protein